MFTMIARMYDSKLAYESVKMAGTFTRPNSRLSLSTAGVSPFFGGDQRSDKTCNSNLSMNPQIRT